MSQLEAESGIGDNMQSVKKNEFRENAIEVKQDFSRWEDEGDQACWNGLSLVEMTSEL